MDVTIPKSLEALVRRQVDDGYSSTEDEVVADALRLMQARDGVERGYGRRCGGRALRRPVRHPMKARLRVLSLVAVCLKEMIMKGMKGYCDDIPR